MPKMSKARLIAISALAVAIALCLLVLPTRDILIVTLEWIQAAGPLGNACVVGLYVVACLFFVPGSLITLATGFIYGVVIGTVTVSIGSTLGATAAFLAGRTLARDWVADRIANSAKFQAIDEAVARQGFKIVLLTRLSPVFPFNLLNYAFGLTRVRLRDYVLASWIGMLPGTVMYVYIGATAKSLSLLASGEIEGGWQQQALFVVGLLATVAVTITITRIARRALNEAIDDNRIEKEGVHEHVRRKARD